MKTARILFAAPKSGSGKTMITCGIIELLKRRGKQVSSYKCGPDYIDPMFHKQVLGIPSYNLDSYFTDEEMTRNLFAMHALDSDISIIEGVMGYYDGLNGTSSIASAYEISKITKTPVVLIVDGKGASVSLAALIKGMMEYKDDSRIVGVILNRVSTGYYERIASVIEQSCNVKVLGYLPELKGLEVPSRHLGLVSPKEMTMFQRWLDEIAAAMEQSIDIDLLMEFANQAIDFDYDHKWQEKMVPHKNEFSNLKIAVARDEAFSFYYSENIELLEYFGATLVPFSPIHDKELPMDSSGIILGGGYPENYAEVLSENVNMRAAIKNAYGKLPILAECGGFLYLQNTLEDSDGMVYEMAGILDGDGVCKKKLSRFGYMQCTSKKDGLVGKKGVTLKGHEFHYWDCTKNGDDFAAGKPVVEFGETSHDAIALTRTYECMIYSDHILAGFPHFYYYSNPDAIYEFLKQCEAMKKFK